jgi:hypothetical protein
LGLLQRSWPLAFYRRRSFYVMRTDAFDRFCTRLEQRFTRMQITDMLRAADFDDTSGFQSKSRSGSRSRPNSPDYQ